MSPAIKIDAISGLAESVIANQRKDNALAVIEACEKREGEIAKAVRKQVCRF